MITLDHRQIEKALAELFMAAGAPDDHAQIVAEHLVDASLAGHDSHGIMRVLQYTKAIENGQLNPAMTPRVVRETSSGAVLDGQMGFGQVAARTAMEMAIAKAKQSGVGAVAVSNCYHTGRIASHSVLAVEQEMVGVAMANAGGGGQSVTPFGGTQPRLATNPISIAAPPADPFPVVLDIASSVAPEGKVRDYLYREEPTPDGWMIDADGRPTNDPAALYHPAGGALLPLGGDVGYKGFGLGFMIDVLAGALSGAGCCSEDEVPAQDGLLLLALNVSQFTPLEDFRRHVLRLVNHVKSCPTAAGFEEVYVPGELEHRQTQQRRESGIPLSKKTWHEIQAMAERLHVQSSLLPVAQAAPTPTEVADATG